MLYDKRWDAKVAPKESKLVEDLKRARDMVSLRWCAKAGRDSFGGVCALIAINRSIGASHAEYLSGRDDAAEMFRLAIGWDNIPGWNDAPGRTRAEVVAAFDKAIELARA